jgi:Fic family protein
MLREVEVALPPQIADVKVSLGSALAGQIEDAMGEITRLDSVHGDHLEPLGVLLLRTEAVASSKIERIQATIDDYARALHGNKANASASAMVAATKALGTMIGEVGRTRTITIETITTAHRALMIEDPDEAAYAGRFRDVQNWIGGSDHSPRGAMYVPPPWETVGGYMDDLVGFSNRDDMPALAQAALAHAQFESIHPHTDGNGRIGRALVNAILRRRSATTRVVVPIASALVAHRDRYFDLLNDYRTGDATPIVSAFAIAAAIAAAESRTTAAQLSEAPTRMRDMVRGVRAGSATAKLLDGLPTDPIFTADEAVDRIGASATSGYDAIERLVAAEVVRPLTTRRRNQVWGATVILDALDDLGTRIEASARHSW